MRRQHKTEVRLSEDERRAIDKASGLLGRSTWMRRVALEAAVVELGLVPSIDEASKLSQETLDTLVHRAASE